MEITRRQIDDVLELRIKGRLDSYWADHLADGLREVVQEGAHKIRLNLSEVNYISSAGIRVLLKFYKQLQSIQGSFLVSNPSEQAKKILDIAGLKAMLMGEATTPTAAPATATTVKSLELEGMRCEVFECEPNATLKCRMTGNPELLQGSRFGEEECRTMSFPDSSFALGLGAFGNDFEDCRSRFGEFLAVAGAAAYLPTDGTNIPDYLVSAGTAVPDFKVLYCLACDGPFAKLARFETNKEAGPVSLSGLADACMAIAGTDAAGIVIVAETLGLMGAALRRSPTRGGSRDMTFEHPKIREWLSFTPERVYPRSVTLVVGVAARNDYTALSTMVRPLGSGSRTVGHLHAAAFSYRPLRRGQIDLRTTVSGLFETETLQGVLHLLNDDRPIMGLGQSEFVRGACWIGPISTVDMERT